MSNEAGPIGTTVPDHIKEALTDREFRDEYERLAPCEELARTCSQNLKKLCDV